MGPQVGKAIVNSLNGTDGAKAHAKVRAPRARRMA